MEVGISHFGVKNWQEKNYAGIIPLKNSPKKKEEEENRKPQAGPVVYLWKGHLILGKKKKRKSQKE